MQKHGKGNRLTVTLHKERATFLRRKLKALKESEPDAKWNMSKVVDLCISFMMLYEREQRKLERAGRA